MGFTASQMGTASLIGKIGGGLTSTIGSYYGAQSQQSALNAQAGLADTNARIAELGAQSALAQGQQQVAALTQRVGQMKSTQRAAMAKNGIDMGSGSAAEVQASADVMKQIDVGTLQLNAMNNAFGYRTQGVNYQNQALMARAGASSISPGSAAFTSLLGSAGKVATSWYQLGKTGGNTGASKVPVVDLQGQAPYSSDPIAGLGSLKGWW